MVRTAVLGVLVALAGCHLALPLQGGADLADDGPGNEAGPDAAVQDSAGDGVVATIVFVGEVPTDLPIGSHVVLQLSVSPAGAQVDAKLAARPCLLKRKGQGQGPTGEVELSLPAGSPGAELVIFAPPAAPPTGSCTITSVAPGPAIQPLTFTVKPPGYVVKNIGDHAITVIEGMEVMTVGKLVGTWWPVQALTFAGGVFGGRWVAVTGDNGDQTVTPSTVGFYSFSAGDSGDLSPWLDLTGKATNPTAVEDTVWSPQGPCPLGPDALYVAGPGADAALKPGDDKGGCTASTPARTWP